MYEKSVQTPNELARLTVDAGWDSLLTSVDAWLQYAEDNELPEGLVKLVKDARDFAHRYRDYFTNLPEAVITLETVDPWNLVDQARESLVKEWDILRQALEQRSNPFYEPRLKEMDELARECLEPLFPLEVAQVSKTYLHKIYDITRFAFSEIPLLGAPFAALHLPETWLAIPHEAGHYIFWNSTKTLEEFAGFYSSLETTMVKALEASQAELKLRGYFRRSGEVYRIWLAWLNEIFADIYGTLLAGPAVGWGIQSVLRARLGMRDLYHLHEDEDHPHPYLRPYIHITTLRQMAKFCAGNSPDLATELEKAADNQERSWLDSWPPDTADTLPTPDNWGSMEDVVHKEVVNVVAGLLATPLGFEDQPDLTLKIVFEQGKLYTEARHQKIVDAIERIKTEPTVRLETRLELCAVAQLAIAEGLDPQMVHRKLGFDLSPGGLEDDPGRKERFTLFLQNTTGKTEEEEQDRAWRRVVGFDIEEAVRHWHSHPHFH